MLLYLIAVVVVVVAGLVAFQRYEKHRKSGLNGSLPSHPAQRPGSLGAKRSLPTSEKAVAVVHGEVPEITPGESLEGVTRVRRGFTAYVPRFVDALMQAENGTLVVSCPDETKSIILDRNGGEVTLEVCWSAADPLALAEGSLLPRSTESVPAVLESRVGGTNDRISYVVRSVLIEILELTEEDGAIFALSLPSEREVRSRN